MKYHFRNKNSFCNAKALYPSAYQTSCAYISHPDLQYSDQTITYTDFKKVKSIVEGNNNLAISYGIDQQRTKSSLTTANKTLTRYYLGDYEEETVNGKTRKIHYISGGNGITALFIQTEGEEDKLYYTHTDFQGNLIALSNPDGTFAERYAYDPWGKRRNPDNWQEDDTRTEFIIHRGYTLHEHLDDFRLINMNGRVYDPYMGMFLSPDPYIQAAGDWLNYNRYSYCLNNPLMYTDPSGEAWWVIPAIAAVLFFTDFGYEVQKAISPIAIKIDLRFGSNQGGIGIDISLGIPQLFPISYRVHAGATYYWKNEDLMGNDLSGWETRYGAEWAVSYYIVGVPVKVSYGGTTFNSKWSGKQTTNLITVGNPVINLKYENDMEPVGFFKYIPFVPKGDGDRYRSASLQINAGPFGIGTNIITGDAGPNRGNKAEMINGKLTYVEDGKYNPNKYRMGTFYFRFGPFRIGRNSEQIRKVFQNQFAHDIMTNGQSKWFEVLALDSKWYWGFGYSGGSTLW